MYVEKHGTENRYGMDGVDGHTHSEVGKPFKFKASQIQSLPKGSFEKQVARQLFVHFKSGQTASLPPCAYARWRQKGSSP
eukprot:366121-Chlamydomonas_euryale.AAC.5